MHLASQYLAAAGISFVAKKDDDSHTNLRYDAEGSYLETHPLSENGDTLALNYSTFSLDWLSQDGMSTFSLDGATHKEAINWITEISAKRLNKEYTFEFHYDLPYDLKDYYTFYLEANDIAQLAQLRAIAENALEQIVRDNHLNSSVRIWPHHFDSGAYSPLKENDQISIGLGMAIPDSVCDTHYFYLSGYKNGSAIDVKDFKELTKGKWVNSGFMGAVQSVTNMNESDTVAFFQEAINQFKNI